VSPSDTQISRPDPARAGPGSWALLALIVVLGLVVRLHGIGFLAPHLMEPDGVVVDYQIRVLDGRGPEVATHPLHAYYPHLVARVASVVPESWVAPSDPHTLSEHLSAASSFRLRGRIAVALLSLLAIPLTWWLARVFLPDPWPLLAAALAAASPFVVWFAQQARPHAAAVPFVLLAICAAIELRRSGGWRAYVVVALAAGLAVGSLQNGVAALGPIGLALILRWKKDGPRVLLGALAAGLAVAAFVARLYPFLFEGHAKDGVAVDGEGTLALSRHQVFLGLFNGRGFEVVWKSLEEYDPLLMASALFGLVAAALAILVGRKRLGPDRTADLAIVLAYALPYLVVIGLYQRTYQRFALPLVPFLAILATYGLFAASRWLGRRFAWIAGSIAVLLACAQFAWSHRLGTVRAAEDTIQRAAAWIVANSSPDTDRIDVMPGLDLPLARTRPSIERDARQKDEQNAPWYRHMCDPRTPPIDAPKYDIAWMDLITPEGRLRAHSEAYGFARALTGRYAVITAWPEGSRPALRAVRQGLAGQYELVARFNADDPDVGEDVPLVHQDDELPYTTPWALRILGAQCVGPSVEIYRLR